MIVGSVLIFVQETLNFWKQLSHVLKYFRAEEDPKARLPSNFINGFLEVRLLFASILSRNHMLIGVYRVGTDLSITTNVRGQPRTKFGVYS